MAALVDRLERLAADGHDEVTVVFERPPSEPIATRLVAVAHAPHAGPNAADDEIVLRVGADPDPGSIRVVTSDRRLAERVQAAGACIESAGRFRALIERAD